MGSPNPNWCIWVAYRPIIPKNSQKKHILGNLILPNISYFGTSKTGRCQAQYLRSRRSTRRFFGFIQPLLIHLSALQVNSAQKVAKKHIFGNLILPNFSYFGTKNGPFGPPSVAGTKIFGVMGVYSYGPITQ